MVCLKNQQEINEMHVGLVYSISRMVLIDRWYLVLHCSGIGCSNTKCSTRAGIGDFLQGSNTDDKDHITRQTLFGS